MMERKAIHEQISSIIDKLSFLNERLADEKKLHAVEIDLLNGYARELQGVIASLGENKTELSVVKDEVRHNPAVEEKPLTVVGKKDVPQSEKRAEPVVEKKAEPVAEQKENEEIKLHQHILEKADTAKVPDDPEAFLEEEKKTTAVEKKPSQIKIHAPEEVVARAKPVSKSQDKDALPLNERFKKESTALADKLKGTKKKSLKDTFDLNERYAFIENLFGGSAEQFNRAVQELGRCASRDQAEQYIKEVETKFAWSEKPDLAQRFSGHVLQMIG